MILELQATPKEVMRAVEALQDLGRNAGVSERELFGVALALEECASNIVNHALQRDARKTFQVRLELEEGRLAIELRDRGPAFDPTAERKPRADDDDVPGGWGIQLVCRHVDEIRYTREGAENVLRLTRRLPPASGPAEPRNDAPDSDARE